jgi:hypothetical protein
MARRSKQSDVENLSEELKVLIEDFQRYNDTDDLRERVLALIPVFHKLRDVGSSLITKHDASSAMARILYYFRKYPFTKISHDEIMVVSGISEFGRRIRQLRKEQGWMITSGQTAKEMADDNDWDNELVNVDSLTNNDYILLSEEADQRAAARWHMANHIRKSKDSVQNKLLRFFKEYVGQPISNEELRYVSGDKKEWARRSRELRTQLGWSVKTRNSDRKDLPVGTYVLEDLDQLPEHDRRIPDSVQVEVLIRDGYACCKCGWKHADLKKGDPRYSLDLHHLELHSKGGANTTNNLVTLCNVHHKKVHKEHMEAAEVRAWVMQPSISA